MKYEQGADLVGGFTTRDCTVDFFLRIRSLIDKNSHVVDLGAGRAAWFEDDNCSTRVKIRDLATDVKTLTAIDEDPAVLTNRASHKQLVAIEGRTNLESESVDLIYSDFVLEHISDCEGFVAEINRILKPGGWFCARTPHKFSYIAIFSSMISNKFHAKVLSMVQPSRKEIDIFPTNYKFNTLKDVSKKFSGWQNKSFIYKTDPGYFFGKKWVYNILNLFHHFLPNFLCGNVLIFVRKSKTGYFDPNN